MQHEAPCGTRDPDVEGQVPLAQGADFGSRALTVAVTEVQFLHEIVGGGGGRNAKLVGEKVRSAGVVDLKAVVNLSDPVLDLAATAGELLKQIPGRSFQVGHHEEVFVIWLPPSTHTTFALRGMRATVAAEECMSALGGWEGYELGGWRRERRDQSRASRGCAL